MHKLKAWITQLWQTTRATYKLQPTNELLLLASFHKHHTLSLQIKNIIPSKLSCMLKYQPSLHTKPQNYLPKKQIHFSPTWKYICTLKKKET